MERTILFYFCWPSFAPDCGGGSGPATMSTPALRVMAIIPPHNSINGASFPSPSPLLLPSDSMATASNSVLSPPLSSAAMVSAATISVISNYEFVLSAFPEREEIVLAPGRATTVRGTNPAGVFSHAFALPSVCQT